MTTFVGTRLEGPRLLRPAVHPDERGFFIESFRSQWLEDLGLAKGEGFVQDNHSRSSRGVLRGMHFQIGRGVGKLVRCARGEIFDVIVDVRRRSPTFGSWEGFRLDDQEAVQLFVPVGFAHGFCVLSDTADVMYKQTGYYAPELERGIRFDDPDVGIEWPLARDDLFVSPRDGSAPGLAQIAHELPF